MREEILLQGIKILGMASFAPQTEITNEDFTKIIDTNDEWITTRTGIKKRHYAMGTTTCEMGLNASREAIARSGISAEDIDLIICTTVTPDTLVPSTACRIQRELGVSGCMAFDINGACSGFVYAVDIAHKYLSSGAVKNVLVVSVEILSRIVDYKDRASCILFGDGAAAAVITAADLPFSSFLGADGRGADYLKASSIHTEKNPFYEVKNIPYEPVDDNNGLLYQDGKEVYKFAVGIMPLAVKTVLEKAGVSIDDVDLIIPHQANIRIIQTAASKLDTSFDKFYLNIENFGNTSSASIPNAFNEAIEKGKIKRGDKIVLVGFGAGLTYGAVYFEY